MNRETPESPGAAPHYPPAKHNNCKMCNLLYKFY